MMGHCHLVYVCVCIGTYCAPFSVSIYPPLYILGAATTAVVVVTVQYDFSFSKIIIVK